MARPLRKLSLAVEKPRRLTAFAASVLAHALAFGAVVIAALGAAGTLPEPAGTVVIAMPLPEMTPPPPPPGPPPGVRPTNVRAPQVPPPDGRLIAPSIDPAQLPQPDEIAFSSVGECTANCVIGGDPSATGPIGGVVTGFGDGPILPPPPPSRPPRVSDIHGPRKVRHVSPVYPQVAIIARIEGKVVLDCLITEEGRIGEVTVLEGNTLLVPAAVDAVREWIYTPTLVSGVRSAVLMKVTVNFNLKR